MAIDFSNLTNEQIRVCDQLRKLKMSAMAEALALQFANPNTELTPFLERISMVVDSEVQLRSENRLRKLIRNASLKYPEATLDEKLKIPERKIDPVFIDRLCECSWIPESKVLSITGCTGTGKSYLACALGVCAMQKGFTVKYLTASRLLNEMKAASASNTSIEYGAFLFGFDLLIIDDFGYSEEEVTKKKPLDYHRMFEILTTREFKKATIIASQIPRSDWYDLFRNDTYADACMDRIVKGNYLIQLEGSSLRG